MILPTFLLLGATNLTSAVSANRLGIASLAWPFGVLLVGLVFEVRRDRRSPVGTGEPGFPCYCARCGGIFWFMPLAKLPTLRRVSINWRT